MKLILPSAGKGTRLRPFSLYRSKSLLKIYSKPIIEHLLERIRSWIKFDEIIIVISPDELGYRTYEFLKKFYPKTFYKIQDEPKGLADAVYCGIRDLNDEILIVLPDAIYDGNFSFDEDFIAVKSVDDPRRFGIVILENGYIVELEEKPDIPRSNLAIVGIYYLKESQVLRKAIEKLYQNNIKTKGEYQLTDALRIMIKENYKIKAVEVESWQDCGKVETYLETMNFIFKRERTKIKSDLRNCKIIGPVFIDKNCIIENSVIGPFVDISEGAIIKNCTIKNSIIMEATEIHNSNIENSVIGSNCKVLSFNGRIILGDFGQVDCGADRI